MQYEHHKLGHTNLLQCIRFTIAIHIWHVNASKIQQRDDKERKISLLFDLKIGKIYYLYRKWAHRAQYKIKKIFSIAWIRVCVHFRVTELKQFNSILNSVIHSLCVFVRKICPKPRLGYRIFHSLSTSTQIFLLLQYSWGIHNGSKTIANNMILCVVLRFSFFFQLQWICSKLHCLSDLQCMFLIKWLTIVGLKFTYN